MSNLVELSKIKLGDYPKASVVGEFFAQVVKVYDGDTITITMRTNPGASYFQYNVRMYGYDAPELKPPADAPNRDKIIGAAQNARDHLKSLILGKPVRVVVHEDNDKYGRLLADVYALAPNTPMSHENYTIHVNALMIGGGHGYEYYGGTKMQ